MSQVIVFVTLYYCSLLKLYSYVCADGYIIVFKNDCGTVIFYTSYNF